MVKIAQFQLPEAFKATTYIISTKFGEGLVEANTIFKESADFLNLQ